MQLSLGSSISNSFQALTPKRGGATTLLEICTAVSYALLRCQLTRRVSLTALSTRCSVTWTGCEASALASAIGDSKKSCFGG